MILLFIILILLLIIIITWYFSTQNVSKIYDNKFNQLKINNKNLYTKVLDRNPFEFCIFNTPNLLVLNQQPYIIYDNQKIYARRKGDIYYQLQIDQIQYHLWRYPDFVNETKRHSLKYIDTYIKFLTQHHIKDKPNQIMEFTSYHGVLDNKVRLWNQLVKRYGTKKASRVMPFTYIIPNDKQSFITNCQGKLGKYILKNSHLGGKTGIKITKSYDEILKYFEQCHDFDISKCPDTVSLGAIKYNLVQPYLSKPFLIKGYKFNFRFYLVIFWKNNKLFPGLYRDFYIAYSHHKYNANLINDKTTQLTSLNEGYFKDTIRYQRPYDQETFFQYMKRYPDFSKPKFIHQLKQKINMIFLSNQKDLGLYCFNNTKQFQVYAIDSEMDSNYNIYIYEANVYYSIYRHIIGKLQTSLYQDIFHHLNLTPHYNKGFWFPNQKKYNI